MRDLLSRTSGDLLSLGDYRAKFEEDYRRLGESGGEFWKLERGQLFQEHDTPSWHAYIRGDWDEALRLAEAQRPDLEQEYREDALRGIQTRWTKIVELPITPYIQWAFHQLRVRVQSGENMRVVPANRVARLEGGSTLPEMITLGTDVMYDIRYTADGDHDGAVRIGDRSTIARCRRLISDLYDIGEDFESFHQREVAHLEPPRRK